MRKSHNIFLLAILILSMTTAAFAGPSPAAGVVNINTADAAQLSNLPGVGEKAAQRIVEYRKQHGSFKDTADLMQVKGFGQKRYDKISAYLTVEGKTTLASKVSSPRKPRSRQPSTTASN